MRLGRIRSGVFLAGTTLTLERRSNSPSISEGR
jgi:hypothetical protein